MNRGEVWWVDFASAAGGEIKKTRPAIIVSNDSSNRFLNRVQVIPLTTSTDRLYPSEAYVTLGGRQVKAMADQITTVSKTRLANLFSNISSDDLIKVEKAIRTQLAMS
ncbi:MAG: type II toxin-antitoxin system PemK/MazF family toxin [Candidatus Riflebacteria bacterium HGW-Riflebacteria-2]|jgi:mRNA interferase MazF|nr:MAG: type II toxin-antitoxin system PemK/MazF family toxin [Candidatus Riflebacteria bacterium HGW-Riflebacteria-2]